MQCYTTGCLFSECDREDFKSDTLRETRTYISGIPLEILYQSSKFITAMFFYTEDQILIHLITRVNVNISNDDLNSGFDTRGISYDKM